MGNYHRGDIYGFISCASADACSAPCRRLGRRPLCRSFRWDFWSCPWGPQTPVMYCPLLRVSSDSNQRSDRHYWWSRTDHVPTAFGTRTGVTSASARSDPLPSRKVTTKRVVFVLCCRLIFSGKCPAVYWRVALHDGQPNPGSG